MLVASALIEGRPERIGSPAHVRRLARPPRAVPQREPDLLALAQPATPPARLGEQLHPAELTDRAHAQRVEAGLVELDGGEQLEVDAGGRGRCLELVGELGRPGLGAEWGATQLHGVHGREVPGDVPGEHERDRGGQRAQAGASPSAGGGSTSADHSTPRSSGVLHSMPKA